MVDSRGSDASVRIEPGPQSDLGEPACRLPEGLPGRVHRWSQALWAPVYFRVGLALVTLGAIAMMGARAQGEPRGTDVLKVTAEDPAVQRSESVSSPPPCVSPPLHEGVPFRLGSGGTAVASPPGTSGDRPGRLVLNTASVADFDRLPGVGPKRAEEIVKLREKLGRFRRLSDLLRVRGVGPKTLKKWQDLVVLDPPPDVEQKPEEPAASKAP